MVGELVPNGGGTGSPSRGNRFPDQPEPIYFQTVRTPNASLVGEEKIYIYRMLGGEFKWLNRVFHVVLVRVCVNVSGCRVTPFKKMSLNLASCIDNNSLSIPPTSYAALIGPMGRERERERERGIDMSMFREGAWYSIRKGHQLGDEVGDWHNGERINQFGQIFWHQARNRCWDWFGKQLQDQFGNRSRDQFHDLCWNPDQDQFRGEGASRFPSLPPHPQPHIEVGLPPSPTTSAQSLDLEKMNATIEIGPHSIWRPMSRSMLESSSRSILRAHFGSLPPLTHNLILNEDQFQLLHSSFPSSVFALRLWARVVNDVWDCQTLSKQTIQEKYKKDNTNVFYMSLPPKRMFQPTQNPNARRVFSRIYDSNS